MSNSIGELLIGNDKTFEYVGFINEIKRGTCAGYKVPLFLSGSDTIDNLENSDMEVYWHVLGSFKNKNS